MQKSIKDVNLANCQRVAIFFRYLSYAFQPAKETI
jgi:hypothetical protein